MAKSNAQKEATTLFGFLNIRKEAGMTAHDVVARVRRILGVKQIGHSGTLDPMATGVLPIAVGQACRLIRFLADDKVYDAEVLFGRSTTTDDIEGEVIDTVDSYPDDEKIEAALPKFIGRIDQYPPLYSAVHVGGRRLYEMARNGELPPEIPLRTVEVFSIENLPLSDQIPTPHNGKRHGAPISNSVSREDIEKCKRTRLLIHCGSGTYIRSIARDLGQLLGSPACLSALARTRVGEFSIADAISLSELEESVKTRSAETLLAAPVKCLDLPRISISEESAKRLRYGQRIQADMPDLSASDNDSRKKEESSSYVMAICDEALTAICSIQPTRADSEQNSLAADADSTHTVVELKPEVVISDGRTT